MKSALSIFSVLTRSPIYVLQKHMQHVITCIRVLPLFFSAVQQDNWATAADHFKAISDAEKQADQVKRDLRMHLPRKIRLLVSRSDILNLLIAQDSLANTTEDIAGVVYGRKMLFPNELFLHYEHMLSLSIHAVEQAYHCIKAINDVVKTSFGSTRVDQVRMTIESLDHSEHKTDLAEIEVRKHLFSIENQLPPVTVIFLYQVIQNTGELADFAQQIGKRLLLLLAT